MYVCVLYHEYDFNNKYIIIMDKDKGGQVSLFLEFCSATAQRWGGQCCRDDASDDGCRHRDVIIAD